PLLRIDRHDIDIAMELAVLKPVVQNEEIAEILALRHDSCCVPIFADHNCSDAAQAICHQEWFIAAVDPGKARSVAATDNKRAARSAAISAGQDHGMVAIFLELFREVDCERRLPGAAHGQIADADDRMIELSGFEKA